MKNAAVHENRSHLRFADTNLPDNLDRDRREQSRGIQLDIQMGSQFSFFVIRHKTFPGSVHPGVTSTVDTILPQCILHLGLAATKRRKRAVLMQNF